MPNIITSQLARDKTKKNIQMLNDISMKRIERMNEINLQAQQKYDKDYQIQNSINK